MAQVAKCQTSKDLATALQTELGLQTSSSAERLSMLDTPVLLGHIIDDDVIDIELGQQACEVLRSLGMNVTWNERKEGGHLGMLKTKGLDSTVAFLEGVLNTPAT